MRMFILLVCLLMSSLVQAGELEQAYEKEFAYLVAEKRALEQRLSTLRSSQTHQLAQVDSDIEVLQKDFLARQNQTDRFNHLIVEASRGVDYAENDDLLLDTTLSQAKESLAKLNRDLDESLSPDQRLATAFQAAAEVIVADGQVNVSDGRYFLANGEAIDGQLINVGRIAKYGVAPQGSGILAPAGNGEFRVWDGLTHAIAEQLAENLSPQVIDIFLFDSVEKGIEKKDEKTFSDEVRAGGLVGEVIIVLGVVGLLLVSLRIVMLMRAGSNIHKIARKVNEKIESGDIDAALRVCSKNVSAASKVIAATLRNLKRDRDHIEDIISESILHESSYIDRFGAAILVIAAISPLLGLLGTVTGMISTFDIITEFGTGDPKMLSSGISEALLTTKFGLVVAIPLLLIGNLLSSWARQIKNDLEQAALHMINTHKK